MKAIKCNRFHYSSVTFYQWIYTIFFVSKENRSNPLNKLGFGKIQTSKLSPQVVASNTWTVESAGIPSVAGLIPAVTQMWFCTMVVMKTD